MNIVIDLRNLNQKQKTGIGEYTEEFLNTCLEIDQKNEYWLFYNDFHRENIFKKEWAKPNVHFVRKNWPNKILNFLFFCHLLKFDRFVLSGIKNKNIKIDWFFLPNLNFVNFSKNVKYILTVHDLSFEFMSHFFCLKRRLWHKLLKPKKVCQQAEKIICPSENTKRDVMDIYKISEKKISVSYLGLAKIFFREFSEETKNILKKKYDLPENFILFLGTFEPRKNINLLLDVYKKTNLFQRGYYLILAGAKGWKNKEIFAKIKNISGVKYISYVAAEDKKALYNLAKIFVYPSFYEGFGLPVLEAMNSQVPVITTNNSSLPEISLDTTILINPYNEYELENAIENLLDNEKIRQKFINKAYQRSQNFSYENHVKNFLTLLFLE
ncbi:MAG: glycosyltransferase family 1 protein [Patescibacteria group bacterium]